MEQIYRQLRAAIGSATKSRYRLARETPVSESQLSRFMVGRKGLSVEAIEELARALDLEIIIRPRSKARPAKR